MPITHRMQQNVPKKIVGEYELHHKIGQGTFAKVYIGEVCVYVYVCYVHVILVCVLCMHIGMHVCLSRFIY